MPWSGSVTGVPFQLANMIFAKLQDLPPVAPFLAMSTIFNFSAKPSMAPSAVPGEVVTGLWTHLSLSILFGLGFALFVIMLRDRAPLVVAGLVYGIALYIFNFQIIGRTLFPFFTSPMGPNQLFELILHAGYGLLLVPFFVGRAGGLGKTPAPTA